MRAPVSHRLVARPRPTTRGAMRQKRQAPGVALLFVLTTIAILTAVGLDFSYSARVNLELATQSRDALRARSLAMSAMNFSRLLLHFQFQLDKLTSGAGAGGLQQMMGALGSGGIDPEQLDALARSAGADPADAMGLLSGLMGGGDTPAAGAAGGMAIRLWDVVPIDSNAMMSFVAAAFPNLDGPAAEERTNAFLRAQSDAEFGDPSAGIPVDASFGEFTGNFGARITDEDQKINVQRLEYALGAGPLATYMQLRAMMDDPRFDFLFEEEDANGDLVRREDLILALKDFIDADETQSLIDLSQVPGPFGESFGDENGPYSRYKRRYKAKNAKLDTLAELHQVWGISDGFMAAFGDRLTVFPDVNSKVNINTDDPMQMLVNILSAARNPNDPALQDPARLQLIMEQFRLVKRFPFIGMSVGTFVAILEGNGIEVQPEVKANSASNASIGDKSSTFRIVATGEAGRVKKTLTAVVRYDAGLGQIMYWSEQ